MLSLTIKSIRANKSRFLLTGLAVLLGVAFMAGTFVLTDTIKKSYDEISANVYRSTDAVVRSARETKASGDGAATRGTIAAETLATVRSAVARSPAKVMLRNSAPSAPPHPISRRSSRYARHAVSNRLS